MKFGIVLLGAIAVAVHGKDCHERAQICPDVQGPTWALFESDCFQENKDQFSDACLRREQHKLGHHSEHRVHKVQKACSDEAEKICPGLPLNDLNLFLNSNCFKNNRAAFGDKCLKKCDKFAALQSNCAGDILKLCDDEKMPTMGPTYFFSKACFQENIAKISPQCKTEYDTFTAAHTNHYIEDHHMSLYEACHADRVSICPEVLPPFNPHSLFTSQCFIDNKDKLSDNCKNMMSGFEAAPHHKHPTLAIESPRVVVHDGPHRNDGRPPHHEDGRHHKHPMAVKLYQSCHEDRLQFCPDIKAPFCPGKLFSSECFKQNIHAMSDPCQNMFKRFNAHHHGFRGLRKRVKLAMREIYHRYPISFVAVATTILTLSLLNLIGVVVVLYRKYVVAPATYSPVATATITTVGPMSKKMEGEKYTLLPGYDTKDSKNSA